MRPRLPEVAYRYNELKCIISHNVYPVNDEFGETWRHFTDAGVFTRFPQSGVFWGAGVATV